MKKIKVKPRESIIIQKEFDAINYISKNKDKFINYVTIFIIVVICLAGVRIWMQNKTANAPVIISQAKDLYYTKNYEASLKLYERFAKEFPKHELTPAALMGIGYCYEELKRYNDAKNIFLDVEKNFPLSAWSNESKKGIERLASI